MRLYLCTKFQVSIMILNNFRHGATSRQIPKEHIQIRIKIQFIKKGVKISSLGLV